MAKQNEKYTYNGVLVLQRKEFWLMATTQTNLEYLTLSEISQSQKGKYCMIPLIWNIQSSQNHSDNK